MDYKKRFIENKIENIIRRKKSVLLLGPRQTGKTTLIERFNPDISLSLVNPSLRLRYEKEPSLLIKEVEALNKSSHGKEPLIIIDEIQKVPELLDSVQFIIDKKLGYFILSGSSARKLRKKSVNLLPGRIIPIRLDPFTYSESADDNIENYLLYGSLPGICREKEHDIKEAELSAYVQIYLEEEIRAEAIVRNVGLFSRFLELAGIESGKIINLSSISQEIGVSHVTIANYFQILEDCLILERVEPLTESLSRKKLIRSNRYLIFDLGVRRVCAQEGTKPSRESLGHMFEQFVGLEIIRLARFQGNKIRVKFWRDVSGIEIDWIIQKENNYIPIEVKWSEAPSERDIKNMNKFLNEYNSSHQGYIICRTENSLQLSPRIQAISWKKINSIFDCL